MIPTDRFALEKHEGPYETWPLRTRLLADGRPTRLRIPGYVLLHQYETPDGYLLVTDCDCPYEEMTSFILLSRGLRLLSCRVFGAPYATFLLERLRWTDERHLTAVFNGGYQCAITIRRWGAPLLFPRLKVRRLREAAPAAT